MSAERFFRFRLPCDQKELPKCSSGVCVVAVIGKGRQNGIKASMLNNIVNRDMFIEPPSEDNRYQNLVEIEGCYDEESKTVFLQLWSYQDTSTIADMCQKAAEEIGLTGYHNFLQSTENQHAKAILYLFSISHVILLVHPGSSFDITYVRLFRVLDSVRTKIQPSVTEALRGLGLSKDWVVTGRPCSPRVLFLFERCNLTQSEVSDTMVMSKTRSQRTPPIKRLQHAIEDQIYRILRKARIITNISNNSLFAVPANQEFVYVWQQREPSPDPVTYYLGELHRNCTMPRESDGPRNRSYQSNRRGNMASGRTAALDEHASRSSASPKPSTTLATGSAATASDPNSFKDFLAQHLELAHSKGFDDNVGRNPVAAVFELPQLRTFFDVGNKLFNFFMLDQPESRAKPHFNTLASLLEIDGRFSELRCAKILPMAERAYREGLPSFFTCSYHKSKLEQAEQVFQQHARGPASDKYLKQLAESCEKFWKNGHQQCEEKSLTDQPCVNGLHRIPEMPETESNASLPVLAHVSQRKTKSACNCGNTQAEREDPFDHRTANYDFYLKLEVQCCETLDKYTIPIFQPSTSDIKAGVTKSAVSIDIKEDDIADLPPPSVVVSTSKEVTRKDSTRFDLASGLSGLSLALSLGQSGGSDIYSPGANASFDPVASHSDLGAIVQSDVGEAPLSPLRQVSTTEYLPGMLHSDSPAGLLPKFPSWSLYCLGKYSSYGPSQGLEQPGFMHGSNFLLPWDISIKAADKWPAVGDSQASKKGKVSTRKTQGGDLTVRMYVGFEYECPRGHRFTLSAADKIFKAPMSGIFKETASKVMHSDMPLYFPCHCHNQKGFMGQLMRVFVCVPEGPLEIKLNPRVKPHPSPSPVFFPCADGSIPLTPGLWVLRLPYVYLGETGVYLMPTDAQALSACRLYKGAISVQET